jgi:putative nucleotidyltransferase with HDIG domain
MVVPSRRQAAQLLLSLAPPDWLLRHSLAVAEVGSFLARRAERAGHAVDRPLVESAALLHDIDKALAAAHPLHALGHGHAGAAWLSERGHGELAAAVANHPVTRLADDAHWQRWSRAATLEERLVAYADKRATRRLVPMAVRFAEWHRRFPGDGQSHATAEQRARELERQVCAVVGLEPAQFGRMRWAGRAVANARQERSR